MIRHLKQWRCGDGGLVLQLRPLHVPQPERRRGQQEANEKSTCDKRERERERVRTELQLWKVFFLQKFLLQQSSPSYSWNVPYFEKWLLLRVSSPAGVQTVEAGLTDVQRSGG